MELYVLNKNREIIDIIDDYTSLIWVKRYNEIGDCELYIMADSDNIRSLTRGNYLIRTDDNMICRIKKIELETDNEKGNYLIVTGYDCKDILNQRIVWNNLNFDGTVEDYIRRMVNDAFNIDGLSASQRRINYFKLANRKGFKEHILEQIIHDNVGEKVQSLCKTYEYGYNVYLENKNLYFNLYKGNDKTRLVTFSPEYDNLISSKYSEDATNVKNVALVGGMGEGKDRETRTSAHEVGIDRYEMFVDASSLTNSITYSELLQLYPDGYASIISPTYIAYRVDFLDIMLVDNIQFAELKDIYTNGITGYVNNSGEYIPVDGSKTLDELETMYPNQVLLFRIPNAIVANLVTATTDTNNNIIPPQPDDKVTIADVIYSDYLLTKGYEEIAKNGVVTAFEASIEPSTTYLYKQDYDLGDIVTIRNEYGISSPARITEIVEIFDENGYSIEPKFEYVEVK